MAKDLKNLGRRSVFDNLTKPKEPQRSVDEGVVTRYAAVPTTNLEDLRRMVATSPDNLDLKDMLAFTLYSNDRIDEALQVFKDLLNRRHKVGIQRLYLGNCYYKKKLYHLAVKEWEHVAKMPDAEPDLKKRAQERIDRVRQGLAIDFG